MNIPHYPKIVTHPMDFKTIEEKLDNSVLGKEVPKPDQPRYLSADQFIADVWLVFLNCVKFNGAEHTISLMGRRLEELFYKSIKNLPPPEVINPAPVKKAPPSPQASTPVICIFVTFRHSQTFRCCRDGETDQDYEGYDLRSEATDVRCFPIKRATNVPAVLKMSGKKSAVILRDYDVPTFEWKDSPEAIQTLYGHGRSLFHSPLV